MSGVAPASPLTIELRRVVRVISVIALSLGTAFAVVEVLARMEAKGLRVRSRSLVAVSGRVRRPREARASVISNCWVWSGCTTLHAPMSLPPSKPAVARA